MLVLGIMYNSIQRLEEEFLIFRRDYRIGETKIEGTIDGGETKIMRTLLNELRLRYPWNIELNLSNRHLEKPAWNLGSVFGLEIQSTLGIEVTVEAVRVNKSSKD